MNLCHLWQVMPRAWWALALTPLLVVAQSDSSRAAYITWGTPVAISGVGDSIVSTQGALHTAINFDSSVNQQTPPPGGQSFSATQTVNGVEFTAQTTPPSGWNASAPVYNLDLYVDGGISNGFQRMLDSLIFGDAVANQSNTETLTLSGLTVNHLYQLQFFVADDRTTNDLNQRTQDFTGGASTSATTANGLSYSLLGSFIADSTSQLITITGYPGGTNPTGNPTLNAYQVRDLGPAPVPEPSTALLASVGIVGFCVFARRHKKRRLK